MRTKIQINDTDYAGRVVIEALSYWNASEPSWAEPAWDERGLDILSGPFVSRAEAEALLLNERDYIEDCGYQVAA